MAGFIPEPKLIPAAYEHQLETTEFGLSNERVYDASDAGTGKTRAWLEVLSARIKDIGGKALVLAPKSILMPAWGEDAKFFTPELSFSIAYANNRRTAFLSEVDIYITNHDAIRWIDFNWKHVFKDRGFHTIIIDEATAFKHSTSMRSKSLRRVVKHFQYRAALSGTPTPNSVTDMWHQALILDGGERLGQSFWRFRNTVCEPKQVGPQTNHLKWVDKEGAAEAVAALMDDITIRHVFEECVDIPPNSLYSVQFTLPAVLRTKYEVLREHAILQLKSGDMAAFNASVVANKMLQLASGAVYDGEGNAQEFDTQRYELVMDLVQARDQCVVAFNWTHQKEGLIKYAEKCKVAYGVIDGTASDKERQRIVKDFQAGRIRAIFAHPASAGHGLTLTRGTTTIWTSPTYNAEHFVQFNKRIYRIGQTRKTETIVIVAQNTIDEAVYEICSGKVDNMMDLLEMIE